MSSQDGEWVVLTTLVTPVINTLMAHLNRNSIIATSPVVAWWWYRLPYGVGIA